MTQQIESQVDSGSLLHREDEIRYILPLNAEETERIRQQHFMLRRAFQGNYEAPLEKRLSSGIVVLDAGCGPATWTLEMSEQYPQSAFHGVDVIPVFTQSIKTQNVHFHVANLNETLPFPDNYFDYVHMRLAAVSLTVDGWRKTLSEFKRILRPGGWLELKEVEFKLYSSGVTSDMFMETLHTAMMSQKMDPLVAYALQKMVEDLRFTNVKKRIVSVPLNHDGEIGALFWENMKGTILSLKPLFAILYPDQYGASEKFIESVERCAEECANNKTTGNWFCVIGQKPSP